jgi:hypothetical protein
MALGITLTLERAQDEGSGPGPLAFHRGSPQPQRFGGFLNRQAGEESRLDHGGLLRVEPGESGGGAIGSQVAPSQVPALSLSPNGPQAALLSLESRVVTQNLLTWFRPDELRERSRALLRTCNPTEGEFHDSDP